MQQQLLEEVGQRQNKLFAIHMVQYNWCMMLAFLREKSLENTPFVEELITKATTNATRFVG